MDTATYKSSERSADDVVGALIGEGFEVGTARPVTRTWLDTFDGRLHAAGLRLELRRAGDLGLVLAGPGVVPAHLPVRGLPRSPTDLPAGPLRTRLAELVDVRALLPLVSLSAQQTLAVRRDAAGKAVATVTVNDGLDVEGGNGGVAWTIEVDELDGYPKPAAQVRGLLDQLGLDRLEGDTLDAAAAAAGVDPAGYSGSATVPLDRGAPALDGYRAVLANLADAVEANWEGTVDDVDPEFLHDLRVAVRRIRSVLSQGKGVIPAEARKRFRDGFGWLGQITGRPRDLDVYLIEWDRYVAPMPEDVAEALGPVLEHLQAERRAEHAGLAGALESGRARQLLADFRGWLDDPVGELDDEARHPLAEVVADRIAAAQRQLLQRGRAIGPLTPAEELHELRKDAKKLRYLLECFGGLLKTTQRKAFLQRLKALQDNLGELQDTEVHAEQLRAVSATLHQAGASSHTLVAAGQLIEHVERRGRAARSAFGELFADYDTKPTRRALTDLLGRSSP